MASRFAIEAVRMPWCEMHQRIKIEDKWEECPVAQITRMILHAKSKNRPSPVEEAKCNLCYRADDVLGQIYPVRIVFYHPYD